MAEWIRHQIYDLTVQGSSLSYVSYTFVKQRYEKQTESYRRARIWLGLILLLVQNADEKTPQL